MAEKYATIIPIIKLPKSLGYFDYSIPQHIDGSIRTGQVVEVPFRNKNIFGIVEKIAEQTEISKNSIKPIIKIASADFYFTKNQLALIKWMAKRYFQSPALIAKAMLPKLLKKPRIASKNNVLVQRWLIDLNKSEAETFANLKDKNLLISKTSLDFYIKASDAAVKSKKQVLILVPEITLSGLFIDSFKKYFGPDRLAIIHSHLSESERFQNWKEIFCGSKKIIIGTRMAVFCPFDSLGLIIVDYEHDSSFKQWDQNPRYHAVDIALMLSEMHQSKLILSSPAPSVTTFHNAEINKFGIFSIENDHKNPRPEIIDMKNEFKMKNFSIFSEALQGELKKIKDGRQAILFINRKGSASFVRCRDCGYVPKCESCGLPYNYARAMNIGEDDLICNHCHEKASMPPFCPQCHGGNFKPVGFGTQRVFDEAAKLLPQLKIGRLDSDLTDEQASAVINDFKNKKIDILVCTQIIFNQAADITADLVAMVSADTTLQIPDYSAAENTRQLFNLAATLPRERFIVQTWNSESEIFKLAIGKDWRKFYNYELSNRKDFGYPPYGNLIKLICQDEIFENAKKEANFLAEKIIKLKKSNSFQFEIFGPTAAAAVKIRGRFRFHIIIKYSEQGKWLDKVIEAVPDSWIIDVEPETMT